MDKPVELRMRIAHTHTLKDGWRLSETTIEVTGSLLDIQTVHRDQIQEIMQKTYDLGSEEADRRNKMDRQVRGGTDAAGNN